jgi:sulfite reductase (ferredoxin)
MSVETWKQKLQADMPEAWAKEIDLFESQIALRKQGKLEEKVFAESRLRRGVYGQRYDNGHRNDGKKTQDIAFPSGALTKGPETMWDAPGMMRIKIPFGGLNPAQMRVLAELAEEYSDAICHVTTRQDVQLHFVHIEDTPPIMRRLAAVGITTREACGNSVRNVTACPLAGVCREESFDVTPYAKACAFFLLGHPDTQDFGRKFKIAFSGCRENACALVSLHDLGGIAVKRFIDGKEKRGFELYVGGGLGSVPHQAKLLDEFVPEEELLPLAQAISRVFARLGEKKNRNRARLKFLVAKLGIEEFKRLVIEERHTMPKDDTWRKYFDEIPRYQETAPFDGVQLNSKPRPQGFDEWAATNVYKQRQSGHAVVTVAVPLGDLSSEQMRRLADLAHRYAGDHVRTTVEQNIVLRWVKEADLPKLYSELKSTGLATPGAGTIVDVTACPGTDTCKLGIASSRGLAGELRFRLAEKSLHMDAAIKNLRIKISGCFNSCGQHHVADIGFYGNSRNINGYTVPHFQVMLGGKWTQNAGSYALAMGSVPSKRIPEVVERITGRYVSERTSGESFQDFIQRIGKVAVKQMLDDLTAVPPHNEDASFYSDWGDPREFTIGDMGVGECAGMVVSLAQFGFAAAESQAFQAQLMMDAGNYRQADDLAYGAMLEAAKALVRIEYLDLPDNPNSIVSEFKSRFYDTQIFFDKYAGGKFAQHLFERHESPDTRYNQETVHRLIEETNLFIDACHACEAKLAAKAPTTGRAQ